MRYRFIYLLIVTFFCLSANAQYRVPQVTDSTMAYYIANVVVQGNKKTKNYIVIRDITFAKGDSILPQALDEALKRSQQNIFNTALFIEVKLDAIRNPKNRQDITIFVTVKERWYIFPNLEFKLYDKNYKEWVNVYNADISRVQYGVRFVHNNLSGRRDVLRLNIINGFSKELSFSYAQPYTDKDLKHGFSIIGGYKSSIGVNYADSVNAGLPRQLCASCTKPNFRLFSQQNYFVGVGYNYRISNYANHGTSITFINNTIADTVAKKNPNYYTGNILTANILDINYTYSYGKLDYFAYPTVGSTFRVGARMRFASKGANQLLLFSFIGKNVALRKRLFFGSTLSTSLKLMPSPYNYNNLKSSNLEIPNLRGLEQYLIYNTFDVGLRNSFRFNFIDKKYKLGLHQKYFDVVPIKAYLRPFADFGYAYLNTTYYNNYSRLNNKLLYTYGIGLDVVTIYDFVIRIDYSFNQLEQRGLFFR